jgi:dTMP kinase
MAAKKVRRGRFIAFEGIDGAGTTTQMDRLVTWLRKRGELAEPTAEPTTGPIGTMIRQILGGRLVSKPSGGEPEGIDRATIALLFAADRIDHLQNEIEPHLAAGRHVICDRYVLSSMAYQGVDVDLKFVRAINIKAPAPDLTLFIKVSPEVAMQRIATSRPDRDLFETLPFQRKVAEGYEACAAAYREGPLVTLDGEASIDRVTTEVQRAVEDML